MDLNLSINPLFDKRLPSTFSSHMEVLCCSDNGYDRIEIPPAHLAPLDDLPPASEPIQPKYDVTIQQPGELFPPPAPPVRQPRTGIAEDGRLAPPPRDKLRGPAAEPPLESCRPGGPRLYDLLNELSLEEFGILSWAIVDREEEIFEFADICDEDKVMMALWNRWIMRYR